MATVKSTITKEFIRLRKFGYLVAIFNDNRRGTKGNNGFPDMVIAGHGYLIFCEVKIGKDRYSPDQEKWKEALVTVDANDQTNRIRYNCVTEINYKEIVDEILMRNF